MYVDDSPSTMRGLRSGTIYCTIAGASIIHQNRATFKTQFLTERQICERFDVSRATANKALSNLVVEGVLEFKKGVGTFVRGGVLDYDLRALVSFTDKASVAGKRPTTRLR